MCWPSSIVLLGLRVLALDDKHLESTSIRGYKTGKNRHLSANTSANLGACDPMLAFLTIPTLEAYEDCIRNKVRVTNMSAAGADMWVKSSCWCEHDVRKTVDKFGCCGHANYAELCKIDCTAPCSSPAAIKCMSECPAMCLEQDYAFDGCKCSGCSAYTRCITERGMNRTHAGNLSLICDDFSFDRSEEVMSFYSCMQQQPRRTNWLRHHSTSYCGCQSNLRASLQRHSCCASIWGSPVCTSKCLSETECATEEARQCLTLCDTKCTVIDPSLITVDCYSSCFEANATCSKYSTCKPTSPRGFDYLCTSGGPPKSNGCCPQLQPGHSAMVDACPALCQTGRTYNLPHGTECQCFGCPTTGAEIQSQLREVVLQQIVARGQQLLTYIAQEAGLTLGPTAEMQRLMLERNRKLQQAIDAHTGDLAMLEQTILVLSSDWNSRIVTEAMVEKQCLDDPSRCPKTRQRHDGRGGGGGGLGVVLAIFLGSLAFLLFLAVFLYVMRGLKRARRARSLQAAGEQSDPSPLPGDSNVVVGRPVEGLASASASEGAPVASSKAG